jgi:hypothetical protein
MSGWDVAFEGSRMQLIETPNAPASEKALRNDSGFVAWGSSTQWIPIDRNLTYRVTGTFRQFLDGGNGTVYLAVRLRDAAGSEIAGDGIWWFYPVNSAAPPLGIWTPYEAEFGANTAKPFPTNARYATVGFILNYAGTLTTGGSRTFDVQGMGIYLAPMRTAWTSLSLATNVSVYGSGFQAPQFRRKGDDVCVRGLARYNTTIPNGLELATLPAGFRPLARLLFISGPGSAGTPSRIDIMNDGRIIVSQSNGQDWAALDGLSFSMTP